MNFNQANFASKLLEMEDTGSPQFITNKNVIIMASICLSDNPSDEKLVSDAINAIGSIEDVADAIFEINSQISFFIGLNLLSVNTDLFSTEWQEASEKRYSGVLIIIDALGTGVDSQESLEALRFIQDISTKKILKSLYLLASTKSNTD